MKIIFEHDLGHHCRPTLLRAMSADPEGLFYGTTVLCECYVSWVLHPSKPLLRRSVEMSGKRGWWVRETMFQARRRRLAMDELANIDAGIAKIEQYLKAEL